MTVTIIKPGKPEKINPTITATCQNCEAEFSFSTSYAQHISDRRDGDFYKISCPCCYKAVYTSG